MPIRTSERARYPADWPKISRQVREEAKNRCERCCAPNGETILRGAGPDAGTYMLEEGEVFCAETGEFKGVRRGSEYEGDRFVRVVLTVAHLNHQPEDCRRENLRAWCQRCHLTYDAKHHARNARETMRRKRADGDLFA